MANYDVHVGKRVQKEITKLPRQVQERILDKLDQLEDGHPADAKKLKGKLDGYYSTRVGSDYWVVY